MFHNKCNIIMGFMFLWIKWKPSNSVQPGIRLQSHLRHRTTMFSRYHPPTLQRIHKVPTWLNGQYGDRCFGSPVIHHQASLPLGTHQGREIINAPLFIDDFSSSSYPPTYVGISIAIYMHLLVPIDCYIS